MTTLVLDHIGIDELRARLDGELLLPADPGYDAKRAYWNGAIDCRPASIIRPRSVLDVQRAIAFGGEQALPITVKTVGPDLSNQSIVSGGVLMDMSLMRGVTIDPLARTARVGAGATWAEFDRATSRFGLGSTGGRFSAGGVAGLTVDGDFGWLMGSFGRAIDNLCAVELVTEADGFVTATAGEHPDLFSALRGGGTTSGLSTAFVLDLHPVDLVLAGTAVYAMDQARDAFAFFRSLVESARDGLAATCSIALDPELHKRVATITVCWSGELRAGERVLEPLMRFGKPLSREIGPMPYLEWPPSSDQRLPRGSRHAGETARLRGVTDGMIEAIIARAAGAPLPGMAITLESRHTTLDRPDAPYQAFATGWWDTPDDDIAGLRWIRGVGEALNQLG